jgi:hypothetical protein
MTTPNTIFPHSTPKRRAIGNIIVGRNQTKSQLNNKLYGNNLKTI